MGSRISHGSNNELKNDYIYNKKIGGVIWKKARSEWKSMRATRLGALAVVQDRA
jgi:hypothetical protein